MHRQTTLDASSETPRILLWDIDGTLIRSARTGAFKDYTIPMLEGVFGTSGRLAEMKVSGMTDLQIVAEALHLEGFTHEDIRERIDHLRERYMEEMHKATGNGVEFFELLPGVREVLQAVADHPRYHSALMTGNIEPAAYLKMELVGLSEFFPLPGAFGDESHDRSDLPALAAERIKRFLNLDLQPDQFIVIGDTPNDIACAPFRGSCSCCRNRPSLHHRRSSRVQPGCLHTRPVQPRISNADTGQAVRHRLLTTEPRAVATGSRHSTPQ